MKLDKKYQTADWRERPLPPEMIFYARVRALLSNVDKVRGGHALPALLRLEM